MRQIVITALTALSLGSAVAYAVAAEPQEMRKAAMKQVGGATGALSKMVKGETPFDAAAAKAAFATMNGVAKEYVSLFPEGSETGMETEAAPAIWTDRAGFEAAVAKFEADTGAAAAMEAVQFDAILRTYKPDQIEAE